MEAGEENGIDVVSKPLALPPEKLSGKVFSSRKTVVSFSNYSFQKTPVNVTVHSSVKRPVEGTQTK